MEDTVPLHQLKQTWPLSSDPVVTMTQAAFIPIACKPPFRLRFASSDHTPSITSSYATVSPSPSTINTTLLSSFQYRSPSAPCAHPSNCALLWFRIGHLRLSDNAAVAQASSLHASTLLPVATVSRRHLYPRVIAALSALHHALLRRGSLLIVRILDDDALHHHVQALCEIVDVVRPKRVLYLQHSPSELFSLLPLRRRAVVISNCNQLAPSSASFSASEYGDNPRSSNLFHAPNILPPPPPNVDHLSNAFTHHLCGTNAESSARVKLLRLLSSQSLTLSQLRLRLSAELYVGTLSDDRVVVEHSRSRYCHMQRGANNSFKRMRSNADTLFPYFADPATLPALAAAGIMAYDVNGGDRRPVEWDTETKSFILKEWEHTENERRMAPRERIREFVRRRRQFLTRAFFPDDVTPDYYSFTLWRFAQRCVSATIGVFGTSSLLFALGIRSGRIGEAAVISWVLKDGLGRVGKMVWAGSMGKDFDVDPKRWRFRSALLYALGNGLEIVTQIFPASFLLFATAANSMKQVSMLTSSACRNAMYRSFGERSQNIANITAKGEAQIVVADLIGMATGIQLSKIFGSSKVHVLGAYSLLTVMDLFGIYMELRQVVFRSMNAERASIVINRMFRDGEFMSPLEVSRKESFFLKARYRQFVRLSSIAKAAKSPEELGMLLATFRKEHFIVSIPRSRKGGPCRLVLRQDATNEDVLRAMLLIGYVQKELKTRGKEAVGLEESERILQHARTLTKRAFPSFKDSLRDNGWDIENLLFSTMKRRGFWGP